MSKLIPSLLLSLGLGVIGSSAQAVEVKLKPVAKENCIKAFSWPLMW
jgi:hypothetical protein